MQPLNYTFGSPTALDVGGSLGQGMQIGQGLLDARRDVVTDQRKTLLFQQLQDDRTRMLAAEQQKIADEKRAQEAAIASRRQMQADIAALGPDPTVAQYREIVLKYPALAEQVKNSMASKGEEEKRMIVADNGRAMAMIEGGNVAGAEAFFREKAEAAKNTPGREKDARDYERMANDIKANPALARQVLGLHLGVTADKDMVENIDRVRQSDSAAKAKEAEAKKLQVEADNADKRAIAELKYTAAQTNKLYADAKIAAERLGFDKEKWAAEFARTAAEMGPLGTANLKPDQVTGINEAQKATTSARMSARGAEDLAKKFREREKNSVDAEGIAGDVAEGAKKFFGAEDELSMMRKQAAGLLNADVLKGLPPGAASDRDIALVREGVISPTADKERVAEGLEAMARIQRDIEAAKSVEAQWIQQNRVLGGAGSSLELRVPGRAKPVKVDPGMTYEEVMDRILEERRAMAGAKK